MNAPGMGCVAVAAFGILLGGCDEGHPQKAVEEDYGRGQKQYTPESEVLKKYVGKTVFVPPSDPERPPILEHWHAREDCPDLKRECSVTKMIKDSSGRIGWKHTYRECEKAQLKDEGVIDSKGFRRELGRCSKCSY